MSSEPRASPARSVGAFSLIETLIAGAMLGLVSAALLSTMSYAAGEAARTRARGIASTDAHAQMERIVGLLQIASNAAATDAELCALLKAPTGPFDTSGGGAVTGTCPFLSATGIPIQGTALRRAVSLTSEDLGAGHPGLHVRIVISGSVLLTPLDFDTHVRR